MRSYALAPEPAPTLGGSTRVSIDSRETPSKHHAAEARVMGTMGDSGFADGRSWSPIFIEMISLHFFKGTGFTPPPPHTK
jgi:hypothetical protein